MTIHHDKLAYGKLSSLQEELSEDKLIEMAKALSGKDRADENEKEKDNTSRNPKSK